MKNIKLTFGFEIEGLFKEGLANELKGGEFVHDGSVEEDTLRERFSPSIKLETIPRTECDNCRYDDGEVLDYCNRHHARFHEEGGTAQEYSSEVFDSLASCIEALSLFTKDNHAWDQSCGLHFHIGSPDWKKLWNIASNDHFITELVDNSATWCECQNDRVYGDRYYFEDYAGPELALQGAKYASEKITEKYRVIRFHPTYRTLEFRFLTPCEHKTENVRNLVNSFIKYASTDIERTFSKHTEDTYKPITLEFMRFVNTKNIDYQIYVPLFKREYYPSGDIQFINGIPLPMVIFPPHASTGETPSSFEPSYYSTGITATDVTVT